MRPIPNSQSQDAQPTELQLREPPPDQIPLTVLAFTTARNSSYDNDPLNQSIYNTDHRVVPTSYVDPKDILCINSSNFSDEQTTKRNHPIMKSNRPKSSPVLGSTTDTDGWPSLFVDPKDTLFENFRTRYLGKPGNASGGNSGFLYLDSKYFEHASCGKSQ